MTSSRTTKKLAHPSNTASARSSIAEEIVALGKALDVIGRDPAASRERVRAAAKSVGASLYTLADRVDLEVDAGVGRALAAVFQSMATAVATVRLPEVRELPPATVGVASRGRPRTLGRPPFDDVDRFLRDCVRKAGSSRVAAAEMAAAHRAWCDAGGGLGLSGKALGQALRARGLISRRSSTIWWIGVRLLPSRSVPLAPSVSAVDENGAADTPPAPSSPTVGKISSHLGRGTLPPAERRQ